MILNVVMPSKNFRNVTNHDRFTVSDSSHMEEHSFDYSTCRPGSHMYLYHDLSKSIIVQLITGSCVNQVHLKNMVLKGRPSDKKFCL